MWRCIHLLSCGLNQNRLHVYKKEGFWREEEKEGRDGKASGEWEKGRELWRRLWFIRFSQSLVQQIPHLHDVLLFENSFIHSLLKAEFSRVLYLQTYTTLISLSLFRVSLSPFRLSLPPSLSHSFSLTHSLSLSLSHVRCATLFQFCAKSYHSICSFSLFVFRTSFLVMDGPRTVRLQRGSEQWEVSVLLLRK